MLVLHTTAFPSSCPDLERLLNGSLRRIFLVEAEPVTLSAAAYPHLDEVCISLDGARLRQVPPRPPSISGETSPALRVDGLSMSAFPLSIGPANVNLSLVARGATFVQEQDTDGQVVLSLQNVTEGKVEISIAHANLEALILALGRAQADKQGIALDDAQLKLKQETAHSLAAELHLRARKLFLSASLCITGRLDLDHQLNLKISCLDCSGDGPIASLARGILAPYLRKIEGRTFPLLPPPLSCVSLRDVRLTAADNLSVTADFGSRA